ncbi:MAG TPA: PorV/PorQ family protein [Candidatus Eisenbacteria bacterium]|nr:PorV/PorQ family protein [Candidatus Eisenbacteria bacterium]
MRRAWAVALIALALAAGAGRAHAQSKTGTALGEFTLIEPSARITGLGNAGVTFDDEIEAAFYNAAAIGRFKGAGVAFTHALWFSGISYDYAAGAIPLGGWGNGYASVTALHSGDIMVRTVDQPDGTGETFSVSDVALGLGYGRAITTRFTMGLQLNYLQETIWHSTASTVTLNVGTLYRATASGLELGSSLTNFGTRARFDGRDLSIFFNQNPTLNGDNNALPGETTTDRFEVPLLFRVGLGMPYRLPGGQVLRWAVDAFHPSDNSESVSFGAEWQPAEALALRAGWQNLFQKDNELGLTLGAGFQTRVRDQRLRLDYGWAAHRSLGSTHRFSLGYQF